MQISEDVLAVLSTLAPYGSMGGLSAVRIEQRLDRKLYAKVNEVLEAIGGKWKRVSAHHEFAFDQLKLATRLDAMITTGEITTDADLGFFATPPALARELVEMANVEQGNRALEPSAGLGAICNALFGAGAVVTAIERELARRDHLRHGRAEPEGGIFSIIDGGRKGPPQIARGRHWAQIIDTVEDCDDFMTYQSDDWFDRIVMNPPFCKVGLGDHLDHVHHAYESFLKPDGVLVSVLPQGVMFRKDKRHTEFRGWVAEHGGAFVQLPDGSFSPSGTNVRTVALRMEGRAW